MSIKYFYLLTIFYIGLHFQSEVITFEYSTERLFKFFVCLGDFPISPVYHFGPFLFQSSVAKR